MSTFVSLGVEFYLVRIFWLKSCGLDRMCRFYLITADANSVYNNHHDQVQRSNPCQPFGQRFGLCSSGVYDYWQEIFEYDRWESGLFRNPWNSSRPWHFEGVGLSVSFGSM
jgi:hypothetical protein